MPVDVQMEWSESLDMSPIRLPNPAVRPSREALDEAVEVLRQAKNPAILAGSRVSERQAMDALVALAERLGAPVMTESGTTHGRLAFPSDHPLNGQGLPLWSPEVRDRLADFDVLLVTGMDLFRQYIYHEPARAIPEHIQLVHLDEDPWQLGKNYPVAVGLWGHTRVGLEELAELLGQRMTPQQVQQAQQRVEAYGSQHQAAREELQQKIKSQADHRPMTPLCLMNAVARVIPENVAIVEEAVTTTNTTLERLGKLTRQSSYFGHRGWALGWGLGCAIGAQLAWPERPVLGLLGEGAAMYGIQGLWSAAHHKIPVRFVICNNAQYQILKVCANEFELPQAQEGNYEGMDLREPEVDLVALAQSLGVPAHRTSEPDEVSDWIKASFDADGPMLLDVPIARGSPSRLNYG
jgi:benzoylformate decarboxylase